MHQQKLSHYLTQKEQLNQRFLANQCGALTYVKIHSQLIDEFILSIIEDINLPKNHVTLLAVGGYGRQESYPHSDIDLAFIIDHHITSEQKNDINKKITQLLTLFWDLKLKVHCPTRTISETLEACQQDITTQTSFVDERFLWGDKALHLQFQTVFKEALNLKTFYEQKINEMRLRHTKYNNTPYALEPNTKESPGTLRDIHLIQWLYKVAGLYHGNWYQLIDSHMMNLQEVEKFEKAHKAFTELRINLHLFYKKQEDKLLFNIQMDMAQHYQFANHDTTRQKASEYFMQRYYWAASIVYRQLQFTQFNLKKIYYPDVYKIKKHLDEHFFVSNNEVETHNPDIFSQQPTLILQAYTHLQNKGPLYRLGIQTQRGIWKARTLINDAFRHNIDNQHQFIQLFKRNTGIVRVVRSMAHLGVLQRIIPAFKNTIGQMQHDLFHVYTVEQHTLMVIRKLRRFAMSEYAHEHPLASKLMMEHPKPELIYISAIFHDIAKGRGGRHEELGAIDIAQFAKQWHFSTEDRQLMVFLVRAHLLMSITSQKHDIDDPMVINQFCSKIHPYDIDEKTQAIEPQKPLHSNQQKQYIKSLYLLTMADMYATSPKVWSSWKGQLLDHLYYHAIQKVEGEQPSQQYVQTQRQKDSLKLLSDMGFGTEDCMGIWKKQNLPYFLKHDEQTIVWHTQQRLTAPEETPLVKARKMPNKPYFEVMILTQDKQELFKTLCAYFYQVKINILQASIHTEKDGEVLDHFTLQKPNHNYLTDSQFIEKIEVDLPKFLQGNIRFKPTSTYEDAQKKREKKTFPIMTQTRLEPNDDKDSFNLFIQTIDRPGVLYAIANYFLKYNINVYVAKITTQRERVEDSFVFKTNQLITEKQQLDFEHGLKTLLDKE